MSKGLYKCKHCKKTIERESNKFWIKSYCEETGKTVHLILQK
jgi:ribosomal protein L37AE/L43A